MNFDTTSFQQVLDYRIFFSLATTVITLIGVAFTIVKSMHSHIDKKFTELDTKMDAFDERLRKKQDKDDFARDMEMISHRIDEQDHIISSLTTRMNQKDLSMIVKTNWEEGIG